MNTTIQNSDLQEKINDYLETLQNSNRSFLIGAGCSKCANMPLTSDLAYLIKEKLNNSSSNSNKTQQVLADVMKNFEIGQNITIEEYISELVDFAAILERRKEKGTENPSIGLGIKKTEYSENDLTTAVKEIQAIIVEIIGSKDFLLNTHNDFIKAIHNRLDNGRNFANVPTNYFVLNYDTLIEDALSLNKINYTDGFRGGAIGWWDPQVFNENNINTKAQLFKLHGSLDWRNSKDDNMPRRLKEKSVHRAYNLGDNVLIYPCATKYKETQNDPFAQLLNKYRELLMKGDKTVLSIIGYRFSDNHINAEIEKALIEGRNLTAIVFTEANSPNDIPMLKKWYNNKDIKPHIKFFTKKGFFHNDIIIFENNDTCLDWWKFEKLTELLKN